MKIQLQFILTACIVNFGLTFDQLQNQETNQINDVKENEGEGVDVGENLKNLFSSMVNNDERNLGVLHGILKQKAEKKHEAFDAMRRELSEAQNRNANKMRNFYIKSHVHENVAAAKREISKSTEELHVGRLDIRVGKIVEVKIHPEEPLFYEMKVDIGSGQLKTMAVPFVKFLSMKELQDRQGLFITNSKSYRLCGVDSEILILYASRDAIVDLLIPPDTAQLGDFVKVNGYERKPDARIDKQDENTYLVIQSELKTNEKKEATYKGVPWNVADKGPAISSSLINARIYAS